MFRDSSALISTALDMLGQRASDRVTGFEGMVASINFDAYGCVQAFLTPPAKDGKLNDGNWFDIKRVSLSDPVLRVMPTPNFAGTRYGEENGGTALPAAPSLPRPSCG